MRNPVKTLALVSPGASRQFRLDFADEIFLDEFAGGGGASTGYWMATGRHVDAAVNHNPDACSMHFMNHPQTLHFCQSVWEVDPLELLNRFMGRKIGGAWYSPDCKHFSKASGGALVDKRIRGLAWILLKWAGRAGGRLNKGGRGPACPRTIFLENVEEFQTWGPLVAKRCPKTGRVVKTDGAVAAVGEVVPYRNQHLVPDPKRKGLYFRRLKSTLTARGATAIECRELRACDYGVPTIRKRLFMVVRFDGRPISWPLPTHGLAASPEVQAGNLLPYRAVAECLDFTIPCPSIFLTKEGARAIGAKRPLESSTLARVAKGVDRYVLKSERPFIVKLTAAIRGEQTLVAPVIAYAQHGGKVRSAESPLHTVAASPKDQNQVIMPVLAATFMAQHNTGVVGHAVDEPASTISSKGAQQAVVGASLVAAKLPMLSTELAASARVVAKFLRDHGIEFEGEFATVGEHVIVDIGMRMLAPRELYRAQGFPEQYIIDRGLVEDPASGQIREVNLTKTAQVRMVGNSVCPPMAAVIIAANLPEMRIQEKAA